ncbi:MAG TPA: alanine racemase [Candidatus Dormibacteraeota bacterium]|nr:alanine racemase [Candidatus Dormibacteraeota bacterium]
MIVNLSALRHNADAWRAFAGGRRLYAVVKADAYGIGTARAVGALDDRVDAWCVTSLEEARSVRACSPRRIICIAALPEQHVDEAVALGVEPSIGSPADVRALERVASTLGVRVRAQLAIRSVAGWVGVAPDDAAELAREIVGGRAIEIVEAWTHLSGEPESKAQAAAFQRAQDAMRTAGLHVADHHVASTAPTLWFDGAPPGGAVRIGIGLFGSTMGAAGRRAPSLSQALEVRCPIERVEEIEAGVGVGYGAAYTTREGDRLVTARFGYADGMPRAFVAASPTVATATTDVRVVAMGMQFLTCVGTARPSEAVEILGPRRPLDDVARAAGVLPHELVLSLATAAVASGTLVDSHAGAGYTTSGASR